MKVREIRIELIIATLALCASAAASIATVVQTRVVGNQLSASVWPYLTFDSTLSPGRLQLALVNDGLGPALVRDARLTVDGKPSASWRAAFKVLIAKSTLRAKFARSKKSALDESDIHVGSVIRPGVTFNVITFANSAIDFPTGSAMASRIEVTVCYCSILGQCWTTDLHTQDEPPREIAGCGQGHVLAY